MRREDGKKFETTSPQALKCERHNCHRVRKIRRKQVCRRKTRLKKFRLIGERQCTPKGQARYVNVWGSVQWKGVYMVGGRYWGVRCTLPFAYYAKFPEVSFPTANLFTANFPETNCHKTFLRTLRKFKISTKPF